MKELTIEEKAKAYDEALEKARLVLQERGNEPDGASILSELFSELTESEGERNERIRLGLIEVLKTVPSGIFEDRGKITLDEAFYWLERKEFEKQGEQKPADKVEPFDKFEGLTDFERTLADICIGWIGEELGWKQYIKDNADILLKIAVKKFNSVQDAPFEQKPAWSEEDKRNLDWLITVCERIHYKSDPQVSPKGALVLKDWLKSLKDRYLPQPK